MQYLPVQAPQPGSDPHPADRPELYRVEYFEERACLEVCLVGTWDRRTFDLFADAYLALIARARMTGGLRYQLVDASRFGKQEAAIADQFPLLVKRAVDGAPMRSACIVPHLLDRIRARPGGDIVNSRYFRTRQDALDWLFGDEA